jgi:hypothetical protein
MLHIVAADKQKAAPRVDVHCIHDRNARLAVTARVDAVACELPQEMDHQADQGEDNGQRNDERHRPRDAVSDAESIRDPLVHNNLITLRRTGCRFLAGSGAGSPLHSAARQFLPRLRHRSLLQIAFAGAEVYLPVTCLPAAAFHLRHPRLSALYAAP